MLCAACAVMGEPTGAQTAPDTVHVGELTLPAPFLGSDTMDSYKLEKGIKTPLNTWVRTTEAGINNLTRVLYINTAHVNAATGDTTKNWLTVDPEDMALRQHTVWSPSDSGRATFLGTRVFGWISGHGAAWHAFTTPTDHRLFPDDGIAPWFLELLPYELGYEATIPVFNMWRKGESYRHVKVVGDGELISGDIKIPCWMVEVEGAGGPPQFIQRRWISKSSRRLLQVRMSKGPDDPEYWGVMRGWY
jgi:hypothetical protein